MLNEEKLKSMKENFLILCQQYEQMGIYLRVLGEMTPEDGKEQVEKVQQNILLQFQQIGEQLKTLVLDVDNLGGEGMMFSAEEKPSCQCDPSVGCICRICLPLEEDN